MHELLKYIACGLETYEVREYIYVEKRCSVRLVIIVAPSMLKVNSSTHCSPHCDQVGCSYTNWGAVVPHWR